MKVLLIDPRGKHIPKQEKPGVALNIGLATLASVLLQHDYKISLFDMANHYCNDDSNLIKLLQQEKIDVIGFSILNSQYNNAIETIKKIRKYTRALIVVGGAEATALKEDIIISSDDSIDIVVLGEAEESFLDLLKYVKNHERDKICLVEGIIINRRRMTDVKPKNITQLDDKYIFTGEVGKVKDLDKYPNPNMDIFGISKMSEYKIMASRGCPFKCNFCFTYLGRSNRRRAPSRIVNQLETDYKKFKFEKY